MCECLLTTTMPVLISGSSIEDFHVHKGLKQGDHLSHFLFLTINEGLTGLVQKAVSMGRFKGYELSNNLYVFVLQFANDTILCVKALRTIFGQINLSLEVLSLCQC